MISNLLRLPLLRFRQKKQTRAKIFSYYRYGIDGIIIIIITTATVRTRQNYLHDGVPQRHLVAVRSSCASH